MLWYALLWPFARVFHSVATLQVLEWFIATGTVALVLFKAPFTLARRVALVFGYFFLYEYGALTRSYGLGVLLTIATMIVITEPKPRWLVRALLPGPPGQHERLRRGASRSRLRPASRYVTVRGGTRRTTGAIPSSRRCSSWRSPRTPTRRPNRRREPRRSWVGTCRSTCTSVPRCSSAPFSALVPIPKLQHSWWNTSIADGHTRIAAIAGVLILIAVTWSVRRSKAALLTWITGVVLVLGFLYTKLGTISNVRYIGHIFVLYVVAMWFVVTDANVGRRGYLLFDGVLTVQVAVAIAAVVLDLFMPFTNAAAAANWFRSHHVANAPICRMSRLRRVGSGRRARPADLLPAG